MSALDVLRDHEHQATTGVEGTAYCALCEAVADVKELVEAARGVHFAIWEGAPNEKEAAEAFRAALARFDRNQQT